MMGGGTSGDEGENQNPKEDWEPRFLQRSMTTIPEISKDLVEEILYRVPATSLNRLRTTCKAWNRLIKDDRRFARNHMVKAAKEFIPLMLTKDYRIFPVNVNLHGIVPSVQVKNELTLLDPNNHQFYISRVIHCDGLLLCTSEKNKSRFVVWNPFTGETKWFQACNAQACTLVLGYYQEDNKPCNKGYKILRFYRGSNYFEIYDFNSESSRILEDIIPPGWDIGYSVLSVSLKGTPYMFATDKSKTHSSISLLKFDFSTEKFVPVPLPYCSHYFASTSLSIVREEKLSVLLQQYYTSKTEIWVTNKIDEATQVVLWSKVLALDLSFSFPFSRSLSFLLDEEKQVFMYCERWMEYKYKSEDEVYVVREDNIVTLTDSRVDAFEESWPIILNYVPSLVQLIERAGDKRKRGN